MEFPNDVSPEGHIHMLMAHDYLLLAPLEDLRLSRREISARLS